MRAGYDSDKQFSLWIVIFSLIIIVAFGFCFAYYINYIKPESYTLGNIKVYDYVPYELKEYLTEDDVLFAQNINDVSFSVEDEQATYTYQFDSVDFNANQNKYVIYVNDELIGNISQRAGTISATMTKSFYDVDESIICEAEISINFAMYTEASMLNVSMDKEALPYFKKYCSLNNFTITLAKSKYDIGGVLGTVEETTSSLTIKLNNNTQDIVITGVKGETYTLATPDDYDNKPFLNWEIINGDGSISNNIFSFGEQDTIISAVYDANPFEVNFLVKNDVVDTKFISSGHYANEPEEPTREGYNFLGWSLDKESIVDVSTMQIEADIEFYALFGRLETVHISRAISIVDEGSSTNTNLLKFFKNNGYVVDLSKSTIYINIWNSTFVGSDGKSQAVELNPNNFGTEITISNVQGNTGDSQGSCYLTLNEDGSYIFNPGDFKISYGMGSMYNTNYTFEIYGNQNLYVITD